MIVVVLCPCNQYFLWINKYLSISIIFTSGWETRSMTVVNIYMVKLDNTHIMLYQNRKQKKQKKGGGDSKKHQRGWWYMGGGGRGLYLYSSF